MAQTMFSNIGMYWRSYSGNNFVGDFMYVVLCTCPNLKVAENIGKTLVKEKIAACINLVKVQESIYSWKGKLVHEAEILMIIKSPKKNLKKLEKRIKELHPYTVPEIVAIAPSKVSKKYLDWVGRS